MFTNDCSLKAGGPFILFEWQTASVAGGHCIRSRKREFETIGLGFVRHPVIAMKVKIRGTEGPGDHPAAIYQ